MLEVATVGEEVESEVSSNMRVVLREGHSCPSNLLVASRLARPLPILFEAHAMQRHFWWGARSGSARMPVPILDAVDHAVAFGGQAIIKATR